MRTIIQALMIVLLLDSFIFMSQLAMTNINPGGTDFFEFEGSDIAKFDAGEFTLNESVVGDLPQPGNPVTVALGSNVFTDVFSTMKNWISSIPGVKHLTMIINAVPTFLKYLGLPKEISFALGFIWNALAFMLAIRFLSKG